MKILKNPALGNALPILGLIAALLAYAGWIAPGFISVNNMFNLMRLAAPLGIICIGQTLVILSSGTNPGCCGGANFRSGNFSASVVHVSTKYRSRIALRLLPGAGSDPAAIPCRTVTQKE